MVGLGDTEQGRAPGERVDMHLHTNVNGNALLCEAQE